MRKLFVLCAAATMAVPAALSADTAPSDVVFGDGGVGKYSQIFYDKLNVVMLKEEKDQHGWVVAIGTAS